jgi:ankyrin repeat protein
VTCRLGVVKLLAKHGADIAAKTNSGKTAADLARAFGWTEVAGYLDGQLKA